ncbi:MAG: type II toxin-antitoxin system VapC family toxin [Sulfuritalea sp.]|nr:type II toxin-antitoxin system VapC family toxin [Sulfuritalea sp.]
MILLDTHVWVRWLAPENGALPASLAQRLDAEADLAVSVVSCWEVAYLHRRGRLVLPLEFDEWLDAALGESGIVCVPLTSGMAVAAAQLSDVHRDPADRFIMATAIQLGISLASLDAAFLNYPELGGLLVSG